MDCRTAGLLDCWTVGLLNAGLLKTQDCWTVEDTGLLDCRTAELLDCSNVERVCMKHKNYRTYIRLILKRKSENKVMMTRNCSCIC